MATIVNNGSILQGIIAQIRYSILLSKPLSLNSRSDYLIDTIPSQWGFSGVTHGDNINLIGVDAPYSIASLNDQVPFPPEFGAFVLDPSRSNGTLSETLNNTASKQDFSRDLTDYSTFLNLASMQSFYSSYVSKDMSLMANRFGFETWDQVEMFHAYLEELVQYFLIQNSTYEIIPLASLMDRNMKDTLGYLNTTLPLSLAARTMASMINDQKTNCTYYFEQATVSATQSATICQGYNFSDPNGVI